MAGLTLKAKDFFFDRAAVMKAVGKARLKTLSKVGAFVQRRGQTSMRYRKSGKASPPGQPPFAHRESGAKLRKLLIFAYDTATESVVIGPAGLGRQSKVPEVEEFGGTVQNKKKITVARRKAYTKKQAEAYKRLVHEGKITPKRREVVTYPAHYPARPTMGPALKAESPNLPKLWANSVKA